MTGSTERGFVLYCVTLLGMQSVQAERKGRSSFKFLWSGGKPEQNKPIETSGQSDQISFSFGYENDQLRFCPKHFAHSVRKLRLHNPKGGYLVKKKKKKTSTNR